MFAAIVRLVSGPVGVLSVIKVLVTLGPHKMTYKDINMTHL